MYRVFEDELGLAIKDAQQTIGAALADARQRQAARREGRLRRCSRSSAVTFGKDGRPLELLRAVYLPEYFRLSISLTRRHS